MKIYLDMCCLNRQFDDQSQQKVSTETAAIEMIKLQLTNGVHSLVWSYVLDYEISKNPFRDRISEIQNWRGYAAEYITFNETIAKEADRLMEHGIKVYDAQHVASATIAECSYFLSTDKRLINKADFMKIPALNPVDFVLKVR